MNLNMDSVIKLITNSTLCTIIGEGEGREKTEVNGYI